MFTDNPFLAVTDFLPPRFMQVYVVLMALAVVVGTAVDLYHKRSAEFFARDRRRAQAAATRTLSGGERAGLAARTLAKEVATSGEFCNPHRRVSHLLMSWGFVIYVVTTAVLVYASPEPDASPLVPLMWHLGVVMILVGGYWFFFLLRVDVAHDGKPAWALGRADLFIGSLLASVTAALVFTLVAATDSPGATRFFFVLYLAFTTLLFVSVPWSKFAHMFYKPVVAFQKRVEVADGSTTLPTPRERRGH